MRKSSSLLATLAGFGLVAFAGAAQAASLPTLVGAGANTLSDENRERLVNRVGGANTIDVGDSVRGVIGFDQLLTPTGTNRTLLGAGTSNDEVSAIFQLLVTGITPTSTPGVFNITFALDPAFATEFNAPAGTMVRLYNDPSQNIQLDNTTIATSEATATNGSLVWNLGFTGAGGTAGAGQGWIGQGGVDLSTVASVGASLGNSNFAISRTDNSGLLGATTLSAQTSIFFGTGAEVIGDSNIRGSGGINTPWPLTSDSTIHFTIGQVIPVPAAVWSGMSMLGALGGISQLKRLRRLI